MKKVVIGVVGGIVAFVAYAWYAWQTVHPTCATSLGQFGDSFGACTSLLTFVALIGLLVQIRQSEQQHKEERDQRVQEHKDEMRTMQKLHDENLAEQKRQHEEILEVQRANHREELEVQRMGFLSSEHPLIQTNPCAVMAFPLEIQGTSPGKVNYCLVWQFIQKGKIVSRNPLLACKLQNASGQMIAFGRCRPGQLPYSQSEVYEVVFPLRNVDPITDHSECIITALFQNSIGGCFKYSEVYSAVELMVAEKVIPLSLLGDAVSELVMTGHSLINFVMSKGYTGRAFVRTKQPICDIPLTTTAFEKEMKDVCSRPYDEAVAVCQGILDERKQVGKLTEYLSRR